MDEHIVLLRLGLNMFVLTLQETALTTGQMTIRKLQLSFAHNAMHSSVLIAISLAENVSFSYFTYGRTDRAAR
jgi:hypothetical protein